MKQILSVLFIYASFTYAAGSTPSLEAGYRQMYNLEFPIAHATFQAYERLNPADPLGPASDAAAYLFSEFDRLRILQSEFFSNNSLFEQMRRPTASPEVKAQFEKSLRRASQLAEARLAAAPDDPDAQFAAVMVHGLRSDYLGLIDRNYLGSLSEVKQGRALADRLLAAHPDYYDAYVAIGVENYLLGLKPAPLRWLLRMGGAQTDKQLGIEKLRLAAEKGKYLQPFARLLLGVAALRDKDVPLAKNFLTGLIAEFPKNHLYREELAKLD